MKRKIIPITVAVLAVVMLMAISNVNAEECRHIIQVIPVVSEETGEPRITTSPANLMIFHTGEADIKDVHLLIVIDNSTYEGLGTITTNTSLTISKSDFELVTVDRLGFGNCEYEVSAIKDKLGVGRDVDIYYNFTVFLEEITTSPTYFTLTVNSNPVRVLVLALGKDRSDVFNACSSFSKSTFVIPEPATIFMAAASIAALGAYAYKRKR
jgi:hypothetical protein